MVSRLDRLFILLDTGSNESVRLAAAKQLGEVQRIQPNDLDYLLRRIKEYSTKPVWETRVAAGHATKCVLEQIGDWPPCNSKPGEDTKLACKQELATRLIEQYANTEQVLNEFDLDKILALFPKLLSTNDTDSPDDLEPVSSTSRGSSRGRGRSRKDSTSRGGKTSKEQLMRQRQLINKELGIAMVDSLNLGLKSTDLVSNDDLQAEYNTDSSETSSPSVTRPASLQQQDARSSLKSSISSYDKLILLLSQSECISGHNHTTTNDVSPPDIKDILSGYDWPLTDITEEYIDNLFSPSWEVRHGAAIELREIVRLQGKSAGRRLELSATCNDKLNQLWLADTALKAVCILVLDRFGDFLFDQMVAPVRENAAQLLGCCVASMELQNAKSILRILLKLLDSPNWETRHGGILGLKYVLNVMKEDFVKQSLVFCFDPIFKCLGDTNDDVSAEAAASLVPVKDLMIETIPDKTPKLIKFLWEHLADLDELTTSTSNIIILLASLITSKSAQLGPSELIKSIPKLWPLLSHSSTAVRVSVLKALITLIRPQTTSCPQWMPDELLSTALRLVFQRSILENMDEARLPLEEVWMHLIKINKNNNMQMIELEKLNLLRSTSQYLNYWLCLTMQPTNTPIDRGHSLWLNIRPDGLQSMEKPDGDVYIGSCTFNAETIDEQKVQVTKCRLLGVRLLGALYANLIHTQDDASDKGNSESQTHAKQTLYYLSDMFVHYLKTMSANQRMFSSWAIESWASHQIQLLEYNFIRLKTIPHDCLRLQLQTALQETNVCYDELANTFTRLQKEAREFMALLVASNLHTNLSTTISTDKKAIYNLNQIQSMCHLNLEVEFSRMASKKQGSSSSSEVHDFTNSETYSKLSSKKLNLSRSMQVSNMERKNLSISVLSSLACAHISWRLIPEDLNLIIEPLLDSLEVEEEPLLQDKSISYLITIFDILCSTDTNMDKNSHLIDDILKRLTGGLHSITANLNEFTAATTTTTTTTTEGPANSSGDSKDCTDQFKIVLLDNLQRKADQRPGLSRRQSSVNSTSSLKRSHSLTSTSSDMDKVFGQDFLLSQNKQQMNETKQRGIREALNKITAHFGEDLPDRLPKFWASITNDITAQIELYLNCDSKSSARNSIETKLLTDLTLLQVIGHSLSDKLKLHLLALFTDLVRLLSSPCAQIRHQASHCIGLVSKLMFGQVAEIIDRQILPLLDHDDNILARCGAIEAVALIIENLELDLVPRINMFIVHVLRRMSDQNDQVRLMSTHCFGKLLSLMPLNIEKDKNSNESKISSQSMDEKSSLSMNQESRFIEQLLDPKKLNNFKIPFEMRAELRSYQQEGLNWLAFLNRFNLHGILCDEMGLGKTFMTICMVASDNYDKPMVKSTSAPKAPPSLIVCPSTLTEHWLYEIEKFLSSETKSILNPVIYGGQQSDRASLRHQILKSDHSSATTTTSQVHGVNLIITSYDILRNDIDFFKSTLWNYCVLDEGHIIKNSKTKLSKALRFLNAKHRLILSGTPIQNNVTELWSLFDFLMPGFLGSERQFNGRYAKPILQSREPKCSPRELEAGALAMESLHRQILPFILRRLKEDVLDDLPPKIIQDYYCELSPLQVQLYEDFTRSKLCTNVTKKAIHQLDYADADDDNHLEAKSSSKSHVFQALRYLKNVCNHPKLVLTDKHSKYTEIKRNLDNEKISLDDICHSSKLKALKQLLIDCGIGVANQSGEEQSINHQAGSTLELELSVVNQHRALVFCQLRSMVDIIENDLLKKHLTSTTYLKLDGSVPTNQRQSIVSRFNNDPSIDLLLLTTQIGGLGLNLTGADTVIFVEHDWNPTRDLQAMDRAHRIGQKKVVNVYRLITKDTLEEKIMGLQKFKTMVSNTVINQDNTGLGTMNVDQLLDLFDGTSNKNTCAAGGDKNKQPASGGGGGGGSKSLFVDLLPELWDQQQYETEYDLSSFVSSLKN